MVNKTKIEWCDATLNPVVDCTYGCNYCYAKQLNNRFKWIPKWEEPKFFPERLEKFTLGNKHKNIFMNSMSDIADWKMEWIAKVLQECISHPLCNFLFLTKRPNMSKINIFNLEADNIWLGISLSSEIDLWRVEKVIKNKNVHKFLSIEPLQNCLNIPNKYIKEFKWIILGSETGNRKDKIIPKKEWIKDIVKMAKKNNIPVFMKESIINIVGKDNMLRQIPVELMYFNKRRTSTGYPIIGIQHPEDL